MRECGKAVVRGLRDMGGGQVLGDEDGGATCPLCIEEMDSTDMSFLPCPCGYQVGLLSSSKALLLLALRVCRDALCEGWFGRCGLTRAGAGARFACSASTTSRTRATSSAPRAALSTTRRSSGSRSSSHRHHDRRCRDRDCDRGRGRGRGRDRLPCDCDGGRDDVVCSREREGGGNERERVHGSDEGGRAGAAGAEEEGRWG
eukprot:1731312-Rhodomonas_salina.2